MPRTTVQPSPSWKRRALQDSAGYRRPRVLERQGRAFAKAAQAGRAKRTNG